MGRRLNTVIPVLPKTLQPRAVDQDAVRKKETAAKQKQSTSFNQRHRAKEQPRIEIGTEVFIRDRNKYGLVTQHSHNPRSVFVEEDGGTILRRNRSALVPTPPQQTEASTVPTTTRCGRIVKPHQLIAFRAKNTMPGCKRKEIIHSEYREYSLHPPPSLFEVMSGPLSNLRKSRKVPLMPESGYSFVKFATYTSIISCLTWYLLPGEEVKPVMEQLFAINLKPSCYPVSFKFWPDCKDDETKLLDEITSHVSSNLTLSKSPRDSKNPRSKPHGSVPDDMELMSSMMSRISQAEIKSQRYTKEIIDKDKKIRILEEKVKILQNARDSSERVSDLERRCLNYQRQIHDMEAFLADYGMVWVGREVDSDASFSDDEDDIDTVSIERGGRWNPATSRTSDFQIDFDQVVRNIQELNAMAGEGISKIQHTKGGARLKHAEPVQLTLYKNGMVMFSGPFRPFSDPLTQRCMADIMDGYFPSELQGRFPDGVPFSVCIYLRDVLR
ncbi:hypothetical protein CAPTEDRAFT_219752 [Capitella teleta]|uniref:UBX domain-containing protein 11 n=1 Tax=Capitella teleta TaxID=283909 RepID=R7ULT8_CAPTE|nr:hypothetical protein CAPTEDRAFT_219752 [Capitella teleta]|eukprot:ELU04902.1 hypothetical protein CAPTEDRAFT_219752 [Capitella teleta]